jgi:aspartate kinase
MIKVFKFGGASVKNAAAVKNVANIIKGYPKDELVIVISAMGKTTNALEAILNAYTSKTTETASLITELKNYHLQIIKDLFESSASEIESELAAIFDNLAQKCDGDPSDDYNFEYDQIVSLGEVISTKIVHAYLHLVGINSSWIDARKVVATNDKWREAKIDWDNSEKQITKVVTECFTKVGKVVISQGFIGYSPEGYTTTLGREGSDFSAAIFAYALNATEVTIWKDVPGMLNADPKWFDNTVLLEKISFREAIELAYFGASVIHPRTIQPLKRKNIPLYIKSFINPEEKGSVIQSSEADDTKIPSFIFKMDQVLISLSPIDFSFVIEENLEEIFAYLNKKSVRMNIMQNSAVSFSFCCDRSRVNIEELVAHFEDKYLVRYNEPLELVTIRHYDNETIERVTVGKNVIVEQKSGQTARLVMLNI